MAHTNSTTHYNLPQFVTTDKPAWLTDVNGAMTAIDTGIFNAQDKADDAADDASQALEDSAAAQTTASTADAKASGAVASIAPDFSTTSTYAVGALVMYNNLLYKCKLAVNTPGAWTGSVNWNRETAAGLNDAMGLRVDDLETKTSAFDPNLSITKSSGSWNIQSITQRQYGRTVFMNVVVTGSGQTVSAGSNGFEGTLSTPIVLKSTGIAYVGTGIVILNIDANGSVTIRPLISNTNWDSSVKVTIPIVFYL